MPAAITMVTAATCCCLLLMAQPTGAGFLAGLGLELISLTPAARGTLSGRDAVTVTFNRAVVALGSDFSGGQLPDDKVPFSLTASQAGLAVGETVILQTPPLHPY